jgi:putative transposase
VTVFCMARKMRVEYEGAIYHVLSRGNRKEAFFRDDDDRGTFLRTLGHNGNGVIS